MEYTVHDVFLLLYYLSFFIAWAMGFSKGGQR